MLTVTCIFLHYFSWQIIVCSSTPSLSLIPFRLPKFRQIRRALVIAEIVRCINFLNYFTVHFGVYTQEIIGRIVLAAQNDSAYSYTFLGSVVRLSVVCHTRAPCLNSSTDLDVIWQVDWRGPMTHCVR